MKTEIIQKYLPREGYTIASVLPLPGNKIAVFTTKYRQALCLDLLNGDHSQVSLDLSGIPGIDTGDTYKGYLNSGDKFGFVHLTKELLLFSSDNTDNYEIVKISNPVKPDEHQRETYVESASPFLINNKLLLGVADHPCIGFPPRYLAFLEFSTAGSFLGLGPKKTVARWQKLFELPKQYFPETEFKDHDRDWLNIRALIQKPDHILVHTTGGASTRLKSGNPFEFNIIARFDTNFNWMENVEIERGLGKFTTDKKHFVLHSANQRNKLLFYDIETLRLDFELSLTAKQNLGDEKATQVQADKLGETILVYNHRFLNRCRLIS